MTKRETPMIREYGESVGGTLVEEFLAVRPSASAGRRSIDAVILPRGKKRVVHYEDVDLEDKDVIVVQAKNARLGMPLMGQTNTDDSLFED